MSRVLVAALMIAAVGPLQAQEAFALLKYIPADANTLAVINTAQILQSPRAVKEGWSKLDHTEYLAGAIPLNPMISRMVLAKEVDPAHPGQGEVLALMPITKPVDLEKIAKLVGGSMTTAGGESAVLTPTGVYYIKLGDQLLAGVRTENKQDIGRLMRFAKENKESKLHKSLNAAAAQSTRHHITVALDTEDLFHEHEVDVAVALAKSIQTDAEQAKLVGKFFKGLKGVDFTANIATEGIQAKIKLSSSSYDFKLQPDFVKAFVIETLARVGAMLTDLQTAKATADDNSVSLTFLVSDAELGRIMSVVLPPASIPSNAEAIAVAPDKPSAQATLKYFNAVNGILDDLKKQSEKGKDYDKGALWYETAASKIEGLSTIGVDKGVVQYGFGTANRLNAIAGSLRGVPAKVEELQGEIYALGYMPRRGLWGPGGGRINPWSYGNNSIQTNAGDVANKQAKVIKDDQKNRDSIWSSIDGKRSETRTAIVEKYNVVPPERK